MMNIGNPTDDAILCDSYNKYILRYNNKINVRAPIYIEDLKENENEELVEPETNDRLKHLSIMANDLLTKAFPNNSKILSFYEQLIAGVAIPTKIKKQIQQALLPLKEEYGRR